MPQRGRTEDEGREGTCKTMTSSSLPHEILADYATGAASPALSLLVASHLTHSPVSRGKVAVMEALGGALLVDEAPAALAEDALERTIARLERGDTEDQPSETDDDADFGPLPRPLGRVLGMGFDQIPWRFLLPGLAEYELEGYEPDQHVSLLRGKPGTRIPQHTHEGLEMTLVLAGALEDGDRVFGPGEVAINTAEDDHTPSITGDEVCYCLIVMDGKLRFTGRFSRVLNLFGE